MFNSFYASKKWFLWAYVGGLFLIFCIFAQVELSVMINKWYREFFDIIQTIDKHTIDDFWDSIINFLYIVIPFVLIASFATYFANIYALRWREAVTYAYLDRWRSMYDDVKGSSQFIQDDVYTFTILVLRFFKLFMTLILFMPILWEISKEISLPIIGIKEGSLVWVAVGISAIGFLVSSFIGSFLPFLKYSSKEAEANFRKELAYAEDDKFRYAREESIAELFKKLKATYGRLFFHNGYFNIWLHSFDKVMIIIPFVLVAPSLFAGLITLGIVMQISNAFSQILGSFSIWKIIVELRLIYKSLREFEKNIGYNTSKKSIKEI